MLFGKLGEKPEYTLVGFFLNINQYLSNKRINFLLSVSRTNRGHVSLFNDLWVFYTRIFADNLFRSMHSAFKILKNSIVRLKFLCTTLKCITPKLNQYYRTRKCLYFTIKFIACSVNKRNEHGFTSHPELWCRPPWRVQILGWWTRSM